jgi:hypothetical protein
VSTEQQSQQGQQPTEGGGNAAPNVTQAQAVSALAALMGHNVAPDAVQAEIDKETATAEQGGGLNYEDAWDKPGAIQQPADTDPMSRFRGGKSYLLDAPVNLPEMNEQGLKDFGHVAPAIGLPADTAQALVTTFAGALTTERNRVLPDGRYDQQRTVSELRFEWAEALEPTLAAIERFCSQRPMLSAFLDSSGVGDSPAALRFLAGAATVGTTPAAARAFIDRVNADAKHPYWQGDRLALSQMKWAYAIVGANG